MANAAILLIVTILLIIAIALYWIHFRGLDQPLFCYQRLYKRRPTGECEEIHGKNTLLGDLDDTGSYVDHELSIDDTDLVKATAVGTDVVESCETAVREITR
jgi:hypothetical protein